MGRAGHVHFSSLSPGREGCGSSQRNPKSLHDSGQPSLVGKGVVCRPPPTADPTTSGATSVGPAASAAPLQPLPPGRPRAEPSLVATLKRRLRKSGFLRGAALEMSGCVRDSTARLYQAKWLSFCDWCHGRGVAPVSATIPFIVDFFIHLRRDKGLSVLEIKGYWATLNSVLTLKGLDLSTSRCCSGVSRGLFLMGSYGLPLGMSLLSFRVLPVPLMSLFGRWMIIFLLTKCSSYWPLPLPSTLGNSTPCRFVSLTPRVGVRHPSVSFLTLW